MDRWKRKEAAKPTGGRKRVRLKRSSRRQTQWSSAEAGGWESERESWGSKIRQGEKKGGTRVGRPENSERNERCV